MISGQSEQSPSTTNRTSTAGSGSASAWTGTQAYIRAVFCLLLGVTLGYLFRGSASPQLLSREVCPVPSRRLLANPDYPQRQQVEQYIAKAKEHAARG